MSGPATGRHTGYRVLVTRPEPDAARTAKKLEAAGYQPLCLPVSETVATGLILPDVGYDAVAVTSANALRHAERAQLQPLLNLPLYAVGERQHLKRERPVSAIFMPVTAGGCIWDSMWQIILRQGVRYYI